MMCAGLRVCTVALVAVLTACSESPPQALGAGEAKAQPAERPPGGPSETAKEPGQGLVRIEFEMPRPAARCDSAWWAGFRRKPDVHREPVPGSDEPHPPLLAPVGTRNVALEKPVTSGDKGPFIGELAQVTDGDKRRVDGTYVELPVGPQWVQVDLQERYAIHAILLWHWYMDEARYYHDVVVQVSDDPKFAAGVRTVFNNDYDNSLGMDKGSELEYPEIPRGKLILCKGIVARYVRLYSRGNSANNLNDYVEVEVYGSPAK